MNTERIAVNCCFIAKCFQFPAPAICVLRKTYRSKGPKRGCSEGTGSGLVGRTAGQAEGAPRNQMEAIFFYGVTQSNGKTLGVRDRKKVYCPHIVKF